MNYVHMQNCSGARAVSYTTFIESRLVFQKVLKNFKKADREAELINYQIFQYGQSMSLSKMTS